MKLTRRTMMRSGLAPAALTLPTLAQETRPPNIVFLISDDHSQPDLGCYGNTVVRTPVLDRMAAEGMRFENCFVSSPQCSPNRSSIMTGCAPHSTGTSRLHAPLPDWEPSVLEPLRDRGYYLGAFRKVHLGKDFDKRWDFYGTAKAPFEKFFDSAPKNRPFLLHMGFTDPHRRYYPGAVSPPHDPARVKVPDFLPDTPAVREDLAHYHDFIARMDGECGQIFELLKQRGLADNTLVIFTADNGMPFPRAKGTCYDAGIRVPLLAWWPGRIRAGAVKSELVSHVDLPVTWLEAAGLQKPARMQGQSFFGLLTGGSHSSRAAVFAERNWHDNFDPIRSVRTERYKLIFNAAPHFPYRPAWDLEDSPTWKSYLDEGRRGRLSLLHRQLLEPSRAMLELYDLKRDPGEFHNLATGPEHSAVLRELTGRLSEWMHATNDYLPPGVTRPGEPVGRGWPVSL